MKNPFSNTFKPEQSKGDRMTLPAGVYAAGIIGAKADDRQLTIQVEIIEGEYTGFYKREYEAQNSRFRAPKYKGVYNLRFTTGVNKEIDDMLEREAKGAAWAVEQSNPGYRWQWETLERDLKGKQVGINVREFDWAIKREDGGWMTGVSTEIARFEDINAVREGKVQTAKKRGLSKKRQAEMAADAPSIDPNVPTAVEDEELPF